MSSRALPKLAAILTLGLAVPTLGADVRNAERLDGGESIDRYADNYCLGGAEGRKLIPNGENVRNPFRQTTVLDCEASGGQPAVMPDLIPVLTDGKLA